MFFYVLTFWGSFSPKTPKISPPVGKSQPNKKSRITSKPLKIDKKPPETGRLLGQFARPIHQHLMERYIDYHRPTWWLAWNVETLVRNECPYEFPSMSAEVFAARRLILDEPAAKLAPFIDRPWCHADLYYIQKLAWTIEAARPSQWVDIRKVPPSARQPAQAENRLN